MSHVPALVPRSSCSGLLHSSREGRLDIPRLPLVSVPGFHLPLAKTSRKRRLRRRASLHSSPRPSTILAFSQKVGEGESSRTSGDGDRETRRSATDRRTVLCHSVMDMENHEGEKKSWGEHLPRSVRSLMCGGVAGSVSKSVIAPLDRTKILFQVSDRPFSFRAARHELLRIVRDEGFTALWKGNTATIARVFPYAGVQFMVHDTLKRALLRAKGIPPPAASSGTRTAVSHGEAAVRDGLHPLERMLLGSSAGAAAVLVTYPLDLMRARLAVQIHDRQYRSLREGMRQLRQREGVRGMFRGIGPTFLGILPYAGLSWMTFGTLKQAAGDALGAPPSPVVSLMCGAAAGLVAQSATYPLDLVRRRMQTEGFMRGAGTIRPLSSYGGVWATLIGIATKEGVRALFKGLAMNWVKGPIAVGISFATFDFLQAKLEGRPRQDRPAQQ